jgi:hypothetical protein
MYNFFNHFIAILDNISGSFKKIIICGDFNIDMLDKTKITYELEYLLLNYNLKVEIKQATRLASSKCIDKIFHNIRGCKSEVLDLALSDHTGQLLKWPVERTCIFKYWFETKRDYSLENRFKFHSYIDSLLFIDVFNSNYPNHVFNSFHETFKLIHDLCFPRIRRKISTRVKPK